MKDGEPTVFRSILPREPCCRGLANVCLFRPPTSPPTVGSSRRIIKCLGRNARHHHGLRRVALVTAPVCYLSRGVVRVRVLSVGTKHIFTTDSNSTESTSSFSSFLLLFFFLFSSFFLLSPPPLLFFLFFLLELSKCQSVMSYKYRYICTFVVTLCLFYHY